MCILVPFLWHNNSNVLRTYHHPAASISRDRSIDMIDPYASMNAMHAMVHSNKLKQLLASYHLSSTQAQAQALPLLISLHHHTPSTDATAVAESYAPSCFPAGRYCVILFFLSWYHAWLLQLVGSRSGPPAWDFTNNQVLHDQLINTTYIYLSEDISILYISITHKSGRN